MTSASDNTGATEYPAKQAADRIDRQAAPEPATDAKQAAPQEHGGRIGPDPTRYGDWEKGGRCIDF